MESGEGAWEGLESTALRTLQAILRNLRFTLSNTGGHCKPLSREMTHHDLTFTRRSLLLC